MARRRNGALARFRFVAGGVPSQLLMTCVTMAFERFGTLSKLMFWSNSQFISQVRTKSEGLMPVTAWLPMFDIRKPNVHGPIGVPALPQGSNVRTGSDTTLRSVMRMVLRQSYKSEAPREQGKGSN